LPRKPVEKVVEHRITLGQKEREMIDTAVAGYTFNKVATPMVALLSDVSALTTLALAYGYWKYGEEFIVFMADSYDSLSALVSDLFAYPQFFPDLAGAAVGGIPNAQYSGAANQGGLGGIISAINSIFGNVGDISTSGQPTDNPDTSWYDEGAI
jgi:hypothetical protein|tara:strand:- start:2012 stop:2473 length:462 start_codon:yes stop_codon:yes gene_type:complete